MPNAVKFKGPIGAVIHRYHTAATVTDWTFTADATGGTITGTLASIDDLFYLGALPLTFTVKRPTGAWRWPIQTITALEQGGRFAATVGPQED
jgi:hypothetical protein